MASLRRTLFMAKQAMKINMATYTTGISAVQGGSAFAGSPAILRGNILVPYLTKYHLTGKHPVSHPNKKEVMNSENIFKVYNRLLQY